VVPKGAESVITFEYVATQNCSLVGLLGYYQGGSMDVSYSSGIPVGTVQLSIANDWRYLFSDLPRYAYDEAGNITGSYHYFVEETGGAMYSATYSDANGNRVSADHPVAEGTVTVRNTLPENSYALPETGGSGSMMYTGPGLLMMAISSLLLLHTTKRRREDALHQQM
jgi:LPXTG-motif cell wall-anchored protein